MRDNVFAAGSGFVQDVWRFSSPFPTPQVGISHGADARLFKPYQFAGSVYAIAPAKEHVGHPAGTWNTMEINCHGTAYRITHNGVVIVNATEAEFPELKDRLVKGFLGLQNHSEHVWFRNARIGPTQP